MEYIGSLFNSHQMKKMQDKQRENKKQVNRRNHTNGYVSRSKHDTNNSINY